MSEISNIRKGIISLIIGGVFYLIFLTYFYVRLLPDMSKITYLSMLLILFLPGLKFLYKEFSLRNRGLLLLIVGTISYILSVIRMITADEGIITPYSVYTTIFLTLIFIFPAIFHILLESFKEDVIRVKKRLLGLTYYVSIVGITFIISLLLFGFGDTHQEYINRKFVISLGLGFLIA